MRAGIVTLERVPIILTHGLMHEKAARSHPPLEGEGRTPSGAKRREGVRGGVMLNRLFTPPRSPSLRSADRPSPSRGGWARAAMHVRRFKLIEARFSHSARLFACARGAAVSCRGSCPQHGACRTRRSQSTGSEHAVGRHRFLN
jgi:hypothetical protein